MKPKNRFLLFIVSCIPGCGQMYQGYMKRGTSLAAVFWVLIFLSVQLRFETLLIFLPLIWLYAFFDSFNLRIWLEEGVAEADGYLFGMSELDFQQMDRLLRKRHSIIGWTLVFFGIKQLYDILIYPFAQFIDDEMYYFLEDSLPRLFLTVGIILLGIWFIRGPKGKDIPTFTPPAQPHFFPDEKEEERNGEV